MPRLILALLAGLTVAPPPARATGATSTVPPAIAAMLAAGRAQAAANAALAAQRAAAAAAAANRAPARSPSRKSAVRDCTNYLDSLCADPDRV